MRTSGSTSSACLGPLNPLAQEFQPIVNPPPAPPPPPTAGKLYELRRTAYKGFGLFATRFIPIGTRILVESPLLTIPDDALHLAWAPYCRLSNAQKAAFDKLHDWAPRYLELDRASRVHLLDPFNRGVGGEGVEAAVAEHIRVMSIFACNNFSVPCGLAVFETASRLNHSCVPNVHHFFNPTLQQQFVHALRDIAPDEELSASYLGSAGDYRPRAQRVEMLQRCYGFTCRCPACADHAQVSDRRRELLGHIAWGLQQHIEGRRDGARYVPMTPDEALLQAEDIISILIDEGLFSTELMKAYRTASTQALAVGNLHKALEYAHDEAEVQRNCLGDEADELREMGADASVWIAHVQAMVKGASRTSDDSADQAQVSKRKAKNQRQKKKAREKKDTLRKKQAEGAAERLGEPDELRSAKTAKDVGGTSIRESKTA